MYFSGEDELAIHTVAAASYRLLADLKAERGMDEAANVYLTSIFYVVRDFRRAGAAIALDEVDNLLLLKQCYSAYTDLTPEELGNAGLVFQLFIGANQAPQPNPASQRDQIIQKLAAAREQDRRQMCSIFITELNKMDRGTNAA